MRIGLLLSNPSPHQVDFLNALAATPGIEAFVGYVEKYNPDRTWGAPKPGLPWSYLPAKPLDIIAGKLAGWIRDNPADIWIVSSVYTSLVTHALCFILHKNRMPYVFLAEPPRPRNGMRRSIQKWLLSNVLKHASGLLATGKESLQRYQSMLGRLPPAASLAYYVDFSDIAKREPAPRGQEGMPVRFVTSAQLIHRKGVDVLIEACRMLPAEGWRLDIYGSGPLESELKKQARTASDFIVFHGSLSYKNRYQAFLDADVLVFPTRWDGWGMVVPEAMAHGLPVISTDQAMSAHDFIVDGINGFIGPAESPGFLADAMQRFIDEPELIPAFSEMSRGAVRDHTPEHGARRLVQFSRSLL